MRIFAVTLTLIIAASPVLSAQRKGCGPTTIPKTLPAAHEILDSAAALSELKEFNKLADQMVFSLVFTGDDSMPRVSPLVGADEQSAFILLRSIWPEKPTGTWALRVAIARDEASGTSSLMLERSTYCPPILESRAPIPQPARILFNAYPGDHRPPPGTAHLYVSLEIAVDEVGNVITAQVTKSSGFTELDGMLVQQWETKKFKPALIDGVPIRALYRAGGQTPRL